MAADQGGQREKTALELAPESRPVSLASVLESTQPIVIFRPFVIDTPWIAAGSTTSPWK